MPNILKCGTCGTDIAYSDEEWDAMVAGLIKFGAEIKGVRCDVCVAQHNADERQRQHVIEARDLRVRTYSAGLIPQAARGCTFKASSVALEARSPKLWAAVRALPLKRNLWLSGSPGTGKTFAARCALNRYISAAQSAAELSACHLQTLGRSFERHEEIQRYARVKLLLLEDIDKPIWDPHGITALWELLDFRASANLRIIVTANEIPKVLRADLLKIDKLPQPTVVSAFERLLPITVIETQGESLRKRKTTDSQQGD